MALSSMEDDSAPLTPVINLCKCLEQLASLQQYEACGHAFLIWDCAKIWIEYSNVLHGTIPGRVMLDPLRSSSHD